MSEIQELLDNVQRRLTAIRAGESIVHNVPPHVTIEHLEETICVLEDIKSRFFLRVPREITYAIGAEFQPGEFGMFAGPVKTLRQMLEHPLRFNSQSHTVRPGADIRDSRACDAEKVCIIRFEGTNGEPIDKVIYRLSKEGVWVRQA